MRSITQQWLQTLVFASAGCGVREKLGYMLEKTVGARNSKSAVISQGKSSEPTKKKNAGG